MAFAVVATPTGDDVESAREWWAGARAGGLQQSVLEGRLAAVALSVAGAAALSAALSGVVAWSVNEYPHAERWDVLMIVDAALLLAFVVRHAYKVWRAGGRAAGGRLRIMSRPGCGCRGCVWPSLL